ncbi:MAG: anti-sigma-D factor RsdA [Pseudonocardiaceae bacterium]
MSGRDDEEHGGYPMGNPYRRRHENGDDPLSGPNDTPVDLAAVQADDALLDMLGASSMTRGDADAELARVLVTWRRDVDAEVIGELVDTDTAVAVIGAARKPASRRHPVLGPAAAAAAVLVIVFSGVGLVAKSAQPGDQLFGLTKVLYADYARSAEAAQKAKGDLAQAETAIKQGKSSQAQQSLKQAQDQLSVVAEAEGRTTLAAQHDHLERMLAGIATSPEPTTPAKPPEETTSSQVLVPPPVSSTPTPTSTPVETSKPTTPPSSTPPTSTKASPSTLSSSEPGTSEPTPRAATPSQQSTVPPVQAPTS